MTTFEKDIVSIVKSVFTETTPILSEAFDYNRAYEFAVKQQIVYLLFEGLSKVEGFEQQPIYQEFFSSALHHVAVAAIQQHEIETIQKQFDENSIDYLFLKGVLLRKLYEKPELRAMGDADVLIREEQLKEIEPIMLQLQYAKGIGEVHEEVWKKEGHLYLELHKSLIPSSSDDLYAYYAEGVWDKASKLVNHEYCFSKEDTFIFLFVHFVKHFRFSGSGMRNIVDFYLYFKAYPNMNEEYIEAELRELSLREFYLHLKKLIYNWFYDGCETEETNRITSMLFYNGIYGNHENKQKAEASLYSRKYKHGKFFRFIGLAFPSLERMKRTYPILDNAPFLLPFCWIARGLKVLFVRPERYIKGVKDIQSISKENAMERESELESIGLKVFFDKNKE